MKLGVLAMLAVVSGSGCVANVEPASFYGEDFEVQITAISQVGCPPNLTTGGTTIAAVLEDSVVVDGRVLPAEIEPPENGSSRVEFNLPQQWFVNGQPVAVMLQLRGTARPTSLDLIGPMTSSASALAGCRADALFTGRMPAEDWGD